MPRDARPLRAIHSHGRPILQRLCLDVDAGLPSNDGTLTRATESQPGGKTRWDLFECTVTTWDADDAVELRVGLTNK